MITTVSSNTMFDVIDNIVEVVLNTYFYWVKDYQFKEDLKQEGYLKAYELLKAGNYDPNQNLRNYLYTGVRNAMTNLNYHNRKENHASLTPYDDDIYEDKDIPTFTSKEQFIDYTISLDVIQKSCDKYNSNYIGNIINYFYDLGILSLHSNNIVQSPNKLIMKAIIVDILWNL